MNATQAAAVAILVDLVRDEFILRDDDLCCLFCGQKNILTIPPTEGQHAEACEIARAMVVLERLRKKGWI